MILDSSAVVAVFLREPGWQAIFEHLASASVIGIGTPTLVETGIVLSARLQRDAAPLLARFTQEFAITPIAFDDPPLAGGDTRVPALWQGQASGRAELR